MKVLILSCNTGEGHNSTGAAIGEWLTARGIVCDTADALAFLSERASEFISWGHVFVYRRLPKLFGVGYRFEENHVPRFIYEESARGAKNLYQFIQHNGYDTVICVHVFAGMMMTELRKKYTSHIKCYFVSTDYTCSPGVFESKMDAYFIPHEDLRAEFVHCGVPSERLVVTGIPVRASFCSKLPRALARHKLNMPENVPLLIFSCGSMGCGPMKKLAEMLVAQLPENCYLAIICGSNRKLYHQLTAMRSPHVRIIGFTNRMNVYMDAADAYLTKAGGLSTTEAIAKRLPLIYVDAVQGCEQHNRAFMLQHGIAVTAADMADLPARAYEMLSDAAKREACVRAMEKEFPACGAETLCRFILEQSMEHRNED